MNQDQQKQAVAMAAAEYVVREVPEGSIIGVGTGSTANFFIDALVPHRERYRGAIASSEATCKRLTGHGFTAFDLNDIDRLPVYVDGADEIDSGLHVIKGGGALTHEKIVAAVAESRWNHYWLRIAA